MSENKPEHDLAEQLSVLGELGPSTQARLNYRRVVANGLPHAAIATRPWWKRSISIPVPLAIAASALAIGGIGMQFRNTAPDVATSTPIESLDPAPPVGRPAQRPLFEMTEVYLCGVGRIETQTFEFTESLTTSKEN